MRLKTIHVKHLKIQISLDASLNFNIILPSKEISIFINGSHLEWRGRLTGHNVESKDHQKSIPVKFSFA
jgi:hypothetical protein